MEIVPGDGRGARVMDEKLVSLSCECHHSTRHRFVFYFLRFFSSFVCFCTLSLRWDNDDGNMHSLTQFIYDARSSTPSHFYYIFVFIIWETSVDTRQRVHYSSGWRERVTIFHTSKKFEGGSRFPRDDFIALRSQTKNYARIECALALRTDGWPLPVRSVCLSSSCATREVDESWHSTPSNLIQFRIEIDAHECVILHRNVDSSVKKFRFSFMFLCGKWCRKCMRLAPCDKYDKVGAGDRRSQFEQMCDPEGRVKCLIVLRRKLKSMRNVLHSAYFPLMETERRRNTLGNKKWTRKSSTVVCDVRLASRWTHHFHLAVFTLIFHMNCVRWFQHRGEVMRQPSDEIIVSTISFKSWK